MLAAPLSTRVARSSIRARRHIACAAAGDDQGTDSPATDSAAFSSSLRQGNSPRPATVSGSGIGFGKKAPVKAPPGKAAAKVPSKGPLLLDGNLPEASWRELDAKVNTYPEMRTFTAIGTGGDDFAAAMVTAVSKVVGKDVGEVTVRPSSGGRYLSVKVEARVTCVEEVVRIFDSMKGDPRLKYLI